MASVNAFNSLMQQFIDELSKVFPKEKKLQTYAKGFPLVCKTSPKMPMEFFTKTFGKHADLILAKDASIFEIDHCSKLLDAVDVKELWEVANDTTKEAIWKYLQNLNFLATTLGMIPPDMMSMIENVAQSCAEKIETGQIDPSAIMSMLPQMMSALGSLPPK